MLCIVSSTQGLVFWCTFGSQLLQMQNTWMYTCIPYTIFHTDSPDLEKVIGYHATGKNDRDVLQLLLDKTDLKPFPKHIDKFFPNLTALVIRSSNFSTIDADTFRLPRLTELDLRFNKITSLKGDSLEFIPNLTWLSFAGNQINYIRNDLVQHSPKLRHLDFTGNVCITVRLTTRQAVLEFEQILPYICNY